MAVIDAHLASELTLDRYQQGFNKNSLFADEVVDHIRDVYFSF